MNKFFFFAILFLIISCIKEKPKEIVSEPTVFQGKAYGSTFRITYYSYGKDLNADIENLMNEFDKSVNTYKDNSYLSILNKSTTGAPADPMLIDLLNISRGLNVRTKGYYDPSIQPLSDLWGFSKEGPKHSPNQFQIDSVKRFTGLQQFHVKNDSVFKADPRAALSFNAITGYINDRIANFLDSKMVENYLIEIGGEILAKGKKPDGSAWTVGIDKPTENSTQPELFASLQLNNEALATSGNYRKFYMNENGRKIVHTMNPLTGNPEITHLLSASVIAPTCAEADATATALMAMGLENAQKYAEERKDIKFFLIWENSENKTEHQAYNGLEAKLAE